MKKRERLAALRLATLLEEFTPEELDRAADALAGGSPLPHELEKLLRDGQRSGARAKSRTRPAHLRESKAVQALKEPDPAKYELLSGFESRLRKGDVLSSTSSLSQFARDLGVTVRSRGRRQDIVSQLVAHLADLPTDTADEIIAAVPDDDVSGDGYHRLATYIHKGYDPGPASGSRLLPDKSGPVRS